MLTEKQKLWIDHLSDENKITIVPFDPTAEEKFQKIKQKVQEALGPQTNVVHCGATSLGISGQDEIDVYVPVPKDKFDSFIDPLKKLFGEPKSLYPLERARFVTDESGKHVDVFLINEEGDGWINGVKFEAYLRSHPEALQEYRLLKENGNGLSVREYYRRKTEFINGILTKAS
jgi:GrpB-like predicted nucleotidyltransferase (UPF0157 family)